MLVSFKDMPSVIHHILKLFADDSKLIGIIRNAKDSELLQEDIDELTKWSRDWRMSFHPEKCKIMDFAKKIEPPLALTMQTSDPSVRHNLAECASEINLGVIVTSNVLFNNHINNSVAKANSILGQLRKTFKNWTIRTFLILYTAYVRPNLEYAAPVWSPHRKQDIKMLEKIQRRATKLIPELKNVRYEDRLLKLNLTTLEERRTVGDLIQLYKILSGFNIVNLRKKLKSVPVVGTRSSPLNLVAPPIPRTPLRNHFFINRVLPEWNKLPYLVQSATNTNQFKNRLDSYQREARRASAISSAEIFRLGSIVF